MSPRCPQKTSPAVKVPQRPPEDLLLAAWFRQEVSRKPREKSPGGPPEAGEATGVAAAAAPWKEDCGRARRPAVNHPWDRGPVPVLMMGVSVKQLGEGKRAHMRFGIRQKQCCLNVSGVETRSFIVQGKKPSLWTHTPQGRIKDRDRHSCHNIASSPGGRQGKHAAPHCKKCWDSGATVKNKSSKMTMEMSLLEDRGSFFKLIDTIASEIGELKQEMVHTEFRVRDEMESPDCLSIHEDMDNSSLTEKIDKKAPLRDSGYESVSYKPSILDRLLHTHPVWLQLGLSDDKVLDVLQDQPPATFLVRKSTKLQKKVLSLRVPNESTSCLQEFIIREYSYTFFLEGSGISFPDIFRLIAFYCISRDVLPFTLKLPHAIAKAKTEAELDELAQLGIGFWKSSTNKKPKYTPPSPKPIPHNYVNRESHQLPLINGVHSIRTRTPSELECCQTNGALCFINPLFLKVHSQDSGGSLKRESTRTQGTNGIERTKSPPPRPPPPSINSHRSSLQLSRAVKQEASMPETVIHSRNGSLDSPSKNTAPIPPPRLKKQATINRWQSNDINSTFNGSSCGSSMESQPGESPPQKTNENMNLNKNCDISARATLLNQRLSDMSISTSSSDSFDYDRMVPPFYEGDSLEYCEEESDQESMSPPVKSRSKRGTSIAFSRIMKSHLRKVSGVFNSLMTPEKKMIKKIAAMSRDKRTYFGCLVQDYISFLQENKECHVSSTDMLLTIRQFMTQVKNYLSQSSELDPPIESLIPEDQIDTVLEKAMHKCILKPLKNHIATMLKQFRLSDGSWKELKENLLLVRERTPQELGVLTPTPESMDVEKIQIKFLTMQKMYSPDKKVMLLLKICKLIYTCMENNSGRMYGADDFLPVLTYVIAQCDMLEIDTEIEYMMELLDPVLLHGEGGYYLTSAYGALSLIKNFREEQASRLLNSETRDTLKQWHKRRTTNRTIPSIDDFQNYLRVALQEVDTGCTGKTLIVKPYTTTEDVCQMCAQRFKVQDPESYGLFLFIDDTWQQLSEDTYPQKIKAELHSRPNLQVFHFVYKRINCDFQGIISYGNDNECDDM
ncbi:ras and Rab interactor 2 isoform X1 [Pelobates cultripes]|uniref:Ras and Rab interactor 2 isoform X1 n=1 Tax=Pelobates cultripes TaxID=61616 RepID=A0AAD1RG69_PELCU|nr:ras and Rab interactor 2 isoform X1 [Pelobates cultripes]